MAASTDPYAILVSEVMAQQTQIDRVVPRWERWLARWPTVEALAAAPAADVIREWQGLGYNRRALALHRAAQQVAAHGWPDDLTELPGVGRYTADAVACFALGRPVLPVDVNVRRVSERTGHAFSPAAAQALMDLGATVCLARVPRCGECPLAEELPVAGNALRAAAQAGPVRRLLPPAARRDAPPRRREARPLAELDAEAVRSLARDGLVSVAGEHRVPARRSAVRSPAMLATDFVTLLIPLWIALGILVLFALLALLGRVQNGRYLRPIFAALSKVPLLRGWLQKASTAAMERSNPELASAMRKLQRTGAHRDPQRAQRRCRQLTAQERRAVLEMQEQQGGLPPEATNREMRRRLEKAQKAGRKR